MWGKQTESIIAPTPSNSPAAGRRRFLVDMFRRPLDGQGLLSPVDPDLATLRRWAAARRRRLLPVGGGLVAGLARLCAPIGSVWRVRRFAHRFAMGPRETGRLLLDCWASGAQPNEAFVWRRVFGKPGIHPLPGRAAGLLLPLLGDPKAHDLLADKVAAARFFAACGVPAPATLAVIGKSKPADLDDPVWTRPGDLIAKPRHGAAGRGVTVIGVAPGHRFRVRDDMVGRAELARRLRLMAEADDVLIQERLKPADELADLATGGRAPVLRLTTARRSGDLPFLYAALLEIDVPGENPHHFIRGRVRVPADPESGILQSGFWFLHPGRRFSRLPWNDAPLAGRAVPSFDAAVEMVLRVAGLLPGLPLASWDLIIGAEGPRILEGNSAGDWILSELPRCVGLHPPPLAPLLRRWLPS